LNTADDLRRRDEARIELLKRERDRLQLTVDARLDASDSESLAVIERIDADIRQVEREIAARDAVRQTEAERLARRAREYDDAVADLKSDIEEFYDNELRFARERASALDAKARTIAALYGRDVAGHVCDVPPWLCLAQGVRSFAAVFSDRPQSHFTLWRNLARQFGFNL
jgi:hypothetical protein